MEGIILPCGIYMWPASLAVLQALMDLASEHPQE